MARRPFKVAKNVDKILREVEKQGAVVESSNGHIKITLPHGRGIYYCASSPSDERAWLNLRAHLRRRGMDL